MAETNERPNILIIHTDEQRADCLGAYGNRLIRTPNLDRLAEDAVRYTHSYCPYGSCTPSRYSLLTGLYVHQHLCRTNRSTLAAGIDALPKVLRRNGYRTKAIGKMHFTPTYLDVGFEQMELAEQDGEGRLDDDYHRELAQQQLVDAWDVIDQRKEFRQRAPTEYWESFGAQPSNLPEEWHSTAWIGKRAVESLESWTGSGNLLMAGFIKPHHPFDPPAPWDSLYDPDELELLPGWTPEVPERDELYHRGYFPNASLSEARLRRIMAYYYGTISHIDSYIGKMLDVLKQRNLYDSTLIVFTSDHGEYMGFHHMLLKGGYLYDPLVRVPLLIKYPRNLGAGTIDETMVSNIDVAPTLLKQVSIDPPDQMKGRDIADRSRDKRVVFAEDRGGTMYMARTERYKLLLARTAEASLFFDLQRDPYELTDCFADPQYRDVIAQLRAAIADWMLFDALTPAYRDEQAACIARPNTDQAGDQRSRMMAYYEREVGAFLESYYHHNE